MAIDNIQCCIRCVLLFYDIVIVKLFCDNIIMRREEQYCMTQREMQKLVVINKVIDGVLTASEAAQVLGCAAGILSNSLER